MTTNCATCPRGDRPCLGLRLPHLCDRPDYRDYLAGHDPEPPAEPPGPLAMAASLGKAVVHFVADGMRHASPEAQASREATCKACPNFNPTAARCNLCGCMFMSAKWAMRLSSCPDSPPRWGPEP